MSNRIQMPGQPPKGDDQPLNLTMTHENGCVQMVFNPPIVRMRLQPREARELAIAMLSHAQLAEMPPPTEPPKLVEG